MCFKSKDTPSKRGEHLLLTAAFEVHFCVTGVRTLGSMSGQTHHHEISTMLNIPLRYDGRSQLVTESSFSLVFLTSFWDPDLRWKVVACSMMVPQIRQAFKKDWGESSDAYAVHKHEQQRCVFAHQTFPNWTAVVQSHKTVQSCCWSYRRQGWSWSRKIAV